MKKSSEIKFPEKTLDVTGLVCPYPEMLTLEALEKLPSGGVIKVRTDNPPSVEAIPHKAKSRGYSVEKLL
ncbi:MAG: sulfurtransferase TusA family protein [Candidatus Hadarchaeales archaeon]